MKITNLSVIFWNEKNEVAHELTGKKLENCRRFVESMLYNENCIDFHQVLLHPAWPFGECKTKEIIKSGKLPYKKVKNKRLFNENDVVRVANALV